MRGVGVGVGVGVECIQGEQRKEVISTRGGQREEGKVKRSLDCTLPVPKPGRGFNQTVQSDALI